jgi:hypothetical protein
MRFVKTPLLLAAFALVVAVAAPSRAHAADPPAHAFGLGIELGAPTGLAAKYYLGSSGGRGGMMALQAGLGVIEGWGPDGWHFHLDVVWHPAVLVRTPDITMPFYFGVGGRILDWNDDYYCDDRPNRVCYGADDTDIGLRIPIGLLMDFHKVPIDVFVELALVMDFIHIEHDDAYDYDHDFLSLDGVLGARFYF